MTGETLLRVSGRAYTNQLPFGERAMYEHTAVPTNNLPTTDECFSLTENGIKEANSLHPVSPEEKFLIGQLEEAREFPWNKVAELEISD